MASARDLNGLINLERPEASDIVKMASGTPPAGQRQKQSALVGLVQQAQQQRQVSLSHDQVLAAMHHFDAINKALKPVMDDANLGKENMRPKLFEAAAKLMGEGVLKLPDVMNAIKTFPTDPAEQKKWMMNAIRSTAMAQERVLQDYRANSEVPPTGDFLGEAKAMNWSRDTHGEHMKGLMSRYG